MKHYEISRMVEDLVWLGLDEETIAVIIKEAIKCSRFVWLGLDEETIAVIIKEAIKCSR